MFTHEDLDYAQGTQLRLYAKNIGLKGRSKLKVRQLKDALRATLPPRQGTPPSLFVELCAGTAAVSLQLHREGARPPVSRMGSKRGYAIAVLHALGLYPGQQAAHYLWCEPDDGCRLLLETYRDHDLALKVAAIIRGWKDEDPRALWERLRKEGPVKAPTPREAARWVYMCARSGGSLPGNAYLPEKHPRPDWGGTGTSRATLARILPDMPELPAEVTEEAVDPREVARWCLDTSWSIGNDAGNGGFNIIKAEGVVFTDRHGNTGHWKPQTTEKIASRLSSTLTLPADVADGAVDPPLLPPNTVVYIDPPYVNTTGYKHDLPRKRVVELALAWYDAGATVAISEQEAIPELVAQGWVAVDITDKRLGQTRTFSNQKTEYLTLSPGAQCSSQPK